MVTAPPALREGHGTGATGVGAGFGESERKLTFTASPGFGGERLKRYFG